MGKITCAWIVLLNVGCGQGMDIVDPATELGNAETHAAPLETSGADRAPAPQATQQTPFCSNDARPAGGRVNLLAAESTPLPEPDPFYRAPQDKDAWRRVTHSSTLAPEDREPADESERDSAEER